MFKRKDFIVARDLGEESILYNPETKRIHILNKTALLIWQLCDGRHSPGDIVNIVQDAFSLSFSKEDGKKVEMDIQAILYDFKAQELIG